MGGGPSECSRACYNRSRGSEAPEWIKGTAAMPIYEYLCEECETHFEKIVINRQQEIACPKCASKKAAIQLSAAATGNGSSNGSSAKSSTSFSGGGSCCGGGCGCH